MLWSVISPCKFHISTFRQFLVLAFALHSTWFKYRVHSNGISKNIRFLHTFYSVSTQEKLLFQCPWSHSAALVCPCFRLLPVSLPRLVYQRLLEKLLICFVALFTEKNLFQIGFKQRMTCPPLALFGGKYAVFFIHLGLIFKTINILIDSYETVNM